MNYGCWCQWEFWKRNHFTLSEDDIVGASLQPPFEKFTNAELCWRLQCRGVIVSTSMKKANIIEKWVRLSSSLHVQTKHWPLYIFFRIHDIIAAKLPVIDVDGVCLYHKMQDLGADLPSMPLPSLPVSGWEIISLDNVREMSAKIPCVTSGKHRVEMQDSWLLVLHFRTFVHLPCQWLW